MYTKKVKSNQQRNMLPL